MGIRRGIDRRTALKLIGVGGASLYLKGCWPLGQKPQAKLDFNTVSPINRTLGSAPQTSFSGDNPHRAHEALWNKGRYLASKKTARGPEKAPLVIVGGGMSGLLTAYLLRDQNPILLEQAPRFGGNAKGESWNGVDYSIGAAYFIKPDEGSEWAKLLTELGADKVWRVKKEDDPVAWKKKIYKDFWAGPTAPEAKAQFRKLAKHFTDMNESRAGLVYPDIPTADPEHRKYIDRLDQISFQDYVRKQLGGQIHPHIEKLLDHYCWSTFGGTLAEVSAASGLNNYASEFDELVVLPGGNSGVAELALKKLMETLPSSNLRPSSLVIDVRVEGNEAHVMYENEKSELREINAKTVVMACPKFVVNRILTGIEPERAAAIAKLRYRSYLVANVLINQAPPAEFYDLFLLESGEHEITDAILANFAKPNPNSTVLTLYRGVPFDGARSHILAPQAFETYRAQFDAQIREKILPLLKLDPGKIVDLRMTRWGHPMPMPAVGLIASGVTDTIRKPFKDRVFFVEQDNWMLPCIETCGAEALATATDIRRALNYA